MASSRAKYELTPILSKVLLARVEVSTIRADTARPQLRPQSEGLSGRCWHDYWRHLPMCKYTAVPLYNITSVQGLLAGNNGVVMVKRDCHAQVWAAGTGKCEVSMEVGGGQQAAQQQLTHLQYIARTSQLLLATADSQLFLFAWKVCEVLEKMQPTPPDLHALLARLHARLCLCRCGLPRERMQSILSIKR